MIEKDYKRALELRKTVSNQMIKKGLKEGRIYYFDENDILKYWNVDWNDLTLMSALITEFFQYEFHDARLN